MLYLTVLEIYDSKYESQYLVFWNQHNSVWEYLKNVHKTYPAKKQPLSIF